MKKKQVVLVVMDGIGITTKDDGNAVMLISLILIS